MNTSAGLKPMYDEDYEEKKKLRIGEVYKAVITRTRNLGFHRKFFALIKIGHENTTNFVDEIPFEVYRKWVIIKAGFYKTYHTKKGIMVEAESIAFGSMDDAKFQELYSKVIDVIIKDICVDKKTIEDQLLDFM